MKIIFLDIDGVHNTRETMYMDRVFKTPTLEGVDSRVPYHLSCYTIRLLNDIIEDTGAKVVISSTWRLRFSYKEMQIILNHYGFSGEVIGSTPNIWNAERGLEIQSWLSESDKQIESYVIIDDMDMCHLSGRLVKTDSNYGIRHKDMKKAIWILNNPQESVLFARGAGIQLLRKLRRLKWKLKWKLFRK